MKTRRLLAAVMVCGATAVIGSACASIIGGLGEDDNTDAVAKMCDCNQALGFLGTEQQCRDYLTERFAGMTAEERRDWLVFFSSSCKACETMASCFYRAPVCKSLGCVKSEECCTFESGGVCDAGKCF